MSLRREFAAQLEGFAPTVAAARHEGFDCKIFLHVHSNGTLGATLEVFKRGGKRADMVRVTLELDETGTAFRDIT